jgi:magnesium-transporting ATPase (P-type)
VVIATGVRTYFGRTTQLVASARPKLHVEAVISRVVRWLLIIVAVLAAITFAKAMILRLPLREVLPVLLVLLMSAFTFETFLFFALWSLLSLRERRAFWRSRPSGALVVSLAAAALVGVLIGVHGAAELAPLSLRTTALIFACGAAASLGPNDLVKTFLCARVLTAGGKRRYPIRSATPAGIPIDGTPRGARSIDPRRGQR